MARHPRHRHSTSTRTSTSNSGTAAAPAPAPAPAAPPQHQHQHPHPRHRHSTGTSTRTSGTGCSTPARRHASARSEAFQWLKRPPAPSCRCAVAAMPRGRVRGAELGRDARGRHPGQLAGRSERDVRRSLPKDPFFRTRNYMLCIEMRQAHFFTRITTCYVYPVPGQPAKPATIPQQRWARAGAAAREPPPPPPTRTCARARLLCLCHATDSSPGSCSRHSTRATATLTATEHAHAWHGACAWPEERDERAGCETACAPPRPTWYPPEH